jgi:hypothetical protein
VARSWDADGKPGGKALRLGAVATLRPHDAQSLVVGTR